MALPSGAQGFVPAETVLRAIHQDDQQRLRAGLGKAVSQGEAFRSEFRLATPDGEECWIAGLGRHVVPGPGGETAGRMIGVNIDVAAWRAADQAREGRDRAAQLARANEALTRPTAQLAGTLELDALMATVLTEAARPAGALSNALSLHDPATQIVSMCAYVHDGLLIDIAADAGMAAWRTPVPVGHYPIWHAVSRGELVTLWPGARSPAVRPQSATWHREMGHALVVAVPSRASARTVAFMGLAFANQAVLALELLRLADAVRAFVAGLLPGDTGRVEVPEQDGARPVPETVSEELLAIIREAVTNAQRHAGPEAYVLVETMTAGDGTVEIWIEDDGAGFDPAAIPGLEAGHYGMWTMRERAARLGATFLCDATPRQRRILNPTGARSQALGTIVFGLGMALHRAVVWDPVVGPQLSTTPTDYHIASGPDVPAALDIGFVETEDGLVNELGAKGVAELGLVGFAGAVANAVRHAPGRPIPQVPITPPYCFRCRPNTRDGRCRPRPRMRGLSERCPLFSAAGPRGGPHAIAYRIVRAITPPKNTAP